MEDTDRGRSSPSSPPIPAGYSDDDERTGRRDLPRGDGEAVRALLRTSMMEDI